MELTLAILKKKKKEQNKQTKRKARWEPGYAEHSVLGRRCIEGEFIVRDFLQRVSYFFSGYRFPLKVYVSV